MANHVQNINHSPFRSMFEREKLYENNFNDWFRQLKLVLRVEKKMHVIEQPIPPAPAADFAANVLAEWNAVYDAHNEVACLMLESMTPELHRQFEIYSPYEMLQELRSMFKKQAGVERFDLIQNFHARKQEDLSVGLILNGLTDDFAGFVRNYNMHNMGKTIDELHALLIEYEKSLPKKAVTPQVMTIQGGRIHKANKKSQNAKGNGKGKGKRMDKSYIPKPKHPKPNAKEHPTKNDARYHCKEMAHPVQNINHSAFRSMFEREKLFVNNFNDWFCQVKLVLSVEKKMHVIEQPIPLAPAADSEANELKSMFEKQAGVERFYLIQTFHACKQEEGKSVAAYVLHMKGYVDQLKCLGYVLPQDLTTIGELHDMLIEYEKGLPKKAETPQVMMIKGGKIQKAKKKSLKAKCKSKANGNGNDKQVYIPKPKNIKPYAKEHPAKDNACHHCKEVGHWKRNCPIYIAELLKKKKLVGSASSSDYGISVSKNNVFYFNAIPSNDFYEIEMHDLVPNQLTPPYTPQHNDVSERRNHTLLDMVRSMMNLTTLPLSFWDYALESAIHILDMVSTKKVDKTPYELWYEKVSNLSYLKVWGYEALMRWDAPDKLQQRSVRCIFISYPKETIEVSGRAIDLKEFQDEDTSPSEITSKIPMEVEGFEPPQEEVISIRRSERTHRALDRLCLNVEVEEHSLGDLNEPASYKAAMLDSESNKWIDAMNAKIQSMIDNMKKTDMDGIVHTYKARLVAKGYTQLYGVDYEETFSPVADIRAIRILIPIAAFYDYEIWQMDVKTAFLNGYLNEDIYMVQPKGFVDPNHPRKDLGKASFILRIKIYRDRSKRLIGLGQNAYMDKILKRYKMDNSKRGYIPMQERLDLNRTQGASTPKEMKCMQNIPYALVVGSIMYTVRCTRPDVAFAQNITSHFQQNPGECHLTAVKHILIGAVDWKSSMKSTTAMSATEAEYIADSKAAMEAVWIRKFISGLGIVPTINEPIRMFCDNSAALHFANEPGVQRGARHYHWRYHYVRESIALE
uniref:Retrotransposon protein, putative, Ty1-copia subclass n=1 Tax=Tanacetum cinerariifolium TaxID=118510 RepID=A0A6L2JSH7_TANCI|nr:hypothetical protein [Tanacetum cinerariifolium]